MLEGQCIARHYRYEPITGRLAEAAFDEDCDALEGTDGALPADAGAQGSYAYDVNGNRICAEAGPGPCEPGDDDEAVVDGQDRLLRARGVDSTYDAAGTLTSRREGTLFECYDYDVFGGLVRYDRYTLDEEDDESTCSSQRFDAQHDAWIEYTNDPLGRRVERVAHVRRADGMFPDHTTRWAYQDALNPIAELDENNRVRVRYVYATHPWSPDVMVEYPDDGGEPIWHQMLRDPRGSIRGWVTLVRDADGTLTRTVREHAAYDPWGQRPSAFPALYLGEELEGELTSLGFAGGIYDPITGLVRFGARDYDPRAGRWTAKDPIGFAGGDTLLYGYVGGDPVNRVDPTGLQATCTQDCPRRDDAACRDLIDDGFAELECPDCEFVCEYLGNCTAEEEPGLVPCPPGFDGDCREYSDSGWYESSDDSQSTEITPY